MEIKGKIDRNQKLIQITADELMDECRKTLEQKVSDIWNTLEPWLINKSHLKISMVIIDYDIYKPTEHILEKIKPRLTKGSLLIFD